MTLDPKRQDGHRTKKVVAPTVPAVGPDRSGAMDPEFLGDEDSALESPPMQAEAPAVALDGQPYRIVLRCQAKRSARSVPTGRGNGANSRS